MSLSMSGPRDALPPLPIFEEFVYGQLLPVRKRDLPRTPGDRTCTICRLPYGSAHEAENDNRPRLNDLLSLSYPGDVEKLAYNGVDQVKISSCSHVYGKVCLLQWMTEHPNCPLCRRILCQRQDSKSTAAIRYHINVYRSFTFREVMTDQRPWARGRHVSTVVHPRLWIDSLTQMQRRFARLLPTVDGFRNIKQGRLEEVVTARWFSETIYNVVDSHDDGELVTTDELRNMLSDALWASVPMDRTETRRIWPQSRASEAEFINNFCHFLVAQCWIWQHYVADEAREETPVLLG